MELFFHSFFQTKYPYCVSKSQFDFSAASVQNSASQGKEFFKQNVNNRRIAFEEILDVENNVELDQ